MCDECCDSNDLGEDGMGSHGGDGIGDRGREILGDPGQDGMTGN